MSSTTIKRVTKAEARRMNAVNQGILESKPASLHPRHQQILNDYTCKSAQEHDRERVHQAFIEVMGRTSHILSAALFRKVCSDVSAFIAWSAYENRDLEWRSLMTHSMIDDYARVEKKQGNTASLSQRYRRLKCLASKLNPGSDAPPRIAPMGHKAVSDPYTAAEMAAIVRMAEAQESVSAKRQFALVLGACRGAGAAVTELRDLRGGDVEDRGEVGVFITLGAGVKRRTIPVRRDWENFIRMGITGIAPHQRALGTVGNRKNIVQLLLGCCVGGRCWLEALRV